MFSIFSSAANWPSMNEHTMMPILKNGISMTPLRTSINQKKKLPTGFRDGLMTLDFS